MATPLANVEKVAGSDGFVGMDTGGGDQASLSLRAEPNAPIPTAKLRGRVLKMVDCYESRRESHLGCASGNCHGHGFFLQACALLASAWAFIPRPCLLAIRTRLVDGCQNDFSCFHV